MEWNERAWAEQVFGRCELGDRRRTARLVRYAAQQAKDASASTHTVCLGDETAAEGAYRLLRNAQVAPAAVAEGGFCHTGEVAQGHGALLAVEDSTTLGFPHAVARALGDIGGPAQSQRRGWVVHSVLLVDRETGRTVGLLEQQRWRRDAATRGKYRARKARPYEQKESYKWQQASERIAERLGETMARVISVCDREADIYEYLTYKRHRQERFIVRAAWDRHLHDSGERLWAHLAQQPPCGTVRLSIPQRGGRQARVAHLTLRSGPVLFHSPQRAGGRLAPLEVQAVYAVEEQAPPGTTPLEWVLLTSEPVATFLEAHQVLEAYRLRWRVEEFHKAWKLGCGIEERRLQTPENLERLAVILAFVAVRLLQLREGVEAVPDQPCDTILQRPQWECLWLSTESPPLPTTVPSTQWAYYALAKLGGWSDTKRTGRVGWLTLWRGWQRLADRAHGYALAQRLRGP